VSAPGCGCASASSVAASTRRVHLGGDLRDLLLRGVPLRDEPLGELRHRVARRVGVAASSAGRYITSSSDSECE